MNEFLKDSVRYILQKVAFLALLLFPLFAPAAIPEPGLTLYGNISSVTGSATNRTTTGTLSWTITPTNGSPIALAVPLGNIDNQFSYYLQLPFEIVMPGQSPSTNTLELLRDGMAYDCSQVWVDGEPAQIVAGGTNFTFSGTTRGTIRRIDLLVQSTIVDTDGDGLPDDWELAYFGNATSTNNATGDFDGDGLDNWGEYRAGCSPIDPASCFRFVYVKPSSGSGFEIHWSSVAGKRYTIERSGSLLSGFVPIATGIDAEPTVNVFVDEGIPPGGTYFYRVVLE